MHTHTLAHTARINRERAPIKKGVYLVPIELYLTNAYKTNKVISVIKCISFTVVYIVWHLPM